MSHQPLQYNGTDLLSVIIPANNEEDYIADCLRTLIAQDPDAGRVEVLVIANACTDRTVEIATAQRSAFAARGWDLKVVDLAEPGKPNALNVGDATASGSFLVYHDADIRSDPGLLGQLRKALSTTEPLYATGALRVAPPATWVTRHYAKFWTKLPFVEGGAVGAGLYGVNRAGRARWETYPDIISDDTYARLHFSPAERVEVPAAYNWPMIEGFSNLVRVRKRQDEGVHELSEQFPDLANNEGKMPLSRDMLARLALSDPIGFLVYAAVSITVRLRKSDRDWVRGR